MASVVSQERRRLRPRGHSPAYRGAAAPLCPVGSWSHRGPTSVFGVYGVHVDKKTNSPRLETTHMLITNGTGTSKHSFFVQWSIYHTAMTKTVGNHTPQNGEPHKPHVERKEPQRGEHTLCMGGALHSQGCLLSPPDVFPMPHWHLARSTCSIHVC